MISESFLFIKILFLFFIVFRCLQKIVAFFLIVFILFMKIIKCSFKRIILIFIRFVVISLNEPSFYL